MMLAICDSYRELGFIDVDDIRAPLRLLWYRGGRLHRAAGTFDVGAATASRPAPRAAACRGERDNGNGSLMRCRPARPRGRHRRRGPRRLGDHARAPHLVPRPACAWCDAARDLVGRVSTAARGRAGLRRRASPPDPQPGALSGGYVLDTFDAAPVVPRALRAPTRSASSPPSTSASDADTTAAVAGALAGIAYGDGRNPPRSGSSPCAGAT